MANEEEGQDGQPGTFECD